MTGLDLRGALTFTPEAKRVEFDSDPGERRGLKETPHHTRPSLSAIRSAPKWPLQLAAASSFLPVRHRTHQRTEIERLSRSSPSLFSVLIFSDRRLSSTPLEILFFLNGWYYATYFLLELFIFLYKGKAWDLTPTLLAPTSLPHFSLEPAPTKSLIFPSSL